MIHFPPFKMIYRDYDPYRVDPNESQENLRGNQRRFEKPRQEEALDLPEPAEKSLHNTIIHMIAQIGKWEGKYPETEYQLGNLGKLDVVWKRIKTGHPSHAFEVQIKGNFYQALAKLKHALDVWNSTPVLVTTDQFFTQAELAKALGVSERSLYDWWQSENWCKAVYDLVRRTRLKHLPAIESSLIKKAKRGSYLHQKGFYRLIGIDLESAGTNQPQVIISFNSGDVG